MKSKRDKVVLNIARSFVVTLLLVTPLCAQESKQAPWTIPLCSEAKGAGKEIRTGFLSYRVPKGMSIKKVRDIDYWVYNVSAKTDKKPEIDILQLWFSVNSSPSPRDLPSVSISHTQRTITSGDSAGLDSEGKTQAGKFWRVAGVGTEQAIYKNVSEESAKLFNSVIDSMCYRPYKN